MNIDVDGLQAFLWIAEFGTFHQAAERLSITQPALSRRLKKLEENLDTGLKMVEAGLGIIAVPKLALPASKNAALVGLPLIDPSLSRTICMVMRRGTTLSPAAIGFAGLLRKRWKNKN